MKSAGINSFSNSISPDLTEKYKLLQSYAAIDLRTQSIPQLHDALGQIAELSPQLAGCYGDPHDIMHPRRWADYYVGMSHRAYVNGLFEKEFNELANSEGQEKAFEEFKIVEKYLEDIMSISLRKTESKADFVCELLVQLDDVYAKHFEGFDLLIDGAESKSSFPDRELTPFLNMNCRGGKSYKEIREEMNKTNVAPIRHDGQIDDETHIGHGGIISED